MMLSWYFLEWAMNRELGFYVLIVLIELKMYSFMRKMSNNKSHTLRANLTCIWLSWVPFQLTSTLRKAALTFSVLNKDLNVMQCWIDS